MKKKKYDVWLFSLKKRENSFNNLTNGPIICQLLVSMRKYFRTSSGRNIKVFSCTKFTNYFSCVPAMPRVLNDLYSCFQPRPF